LRKAIARLWQGFAQSGAADTELALTQLRGRSLQVQHEGQFLSCCAVVTGVMRSMFVVPHPDVLAVHAEDIRAAQQEADADPSTRGHLMKTLHVRPAPAALRSPHP